MENFTIKLRWKLQQLGVWWATITKNEFHSSLNLNYHIICCEDKALVDEYRDWIIKKRNILHELT